MKEPHVWNGRPRTGIVFHRYDVFLIPFSLVWDFGALSVFGAPDVSFNGSGDANLSHAIGGFWPAIPVLAVALAVGVYLTIGRFAIDVFRRKKIRYSLTRNEAIIESAFPFRSERRIDLRLTSDIALRLTRDGSGTIVLGPGAPSERRELGGTRGAPMFEAIPRAEYVFQLIVSLRAHRDDARSV